MKIVLFDSSEGGALGWSWSVGSFRPGWTRIGAGSWLNDADSKLDAAVRPGTRLKELQIWGHGTPGAPEMDGEPMPSLFVDRLSLLVEPSSLVWFRSCSTFFGNSGQAFAERTSNKLGCRIAGHTHVIGIWQSGLYSVEPGLAGDWPTNKYSNCDWTKLKSGWRERRTINCLRMSFPDSW